MLTTTPLPTELISERPAFRRGRRILRWVVRAGIFAALVAAVSHELRTSALQARLLPHYTAKLSYELAPGPSEQIAFPQAGPFDDRRGYSRIGDFQARLEQHGFEVTQQMRLSPELIRLIEWGVTPPYREPPTAGLVIRARGRTSLYDSIRSQRQFTRFEEIPPALVESLLFIENRELLAPLDPRANPAIEWDRLAKAGLLYTGNKLGLPVPLHGGSTLAIQLEKYRHSPGGRTASPADKLRQVASASLKAYREGPDTRPSRRDIVVDYFNTAPLAGAPAFGEINGLGDGLYVWFGLELADVRQQLLAPGVTPAKARAYKHSLALLIALRAPSTYLLKARDALETKVNEYTRLLARDGIIDGALADAVVATPITFLPKAPLAPPPSFTEQKAANSVRTTLMRWLDVPSFYELDRLHLTVDTPIDVPLQGDVEKLFQEMRSPKFVKANGLNQERLLRGADPTNVIYSLMLFERTPQGNVLRVQADNLDRPLDINDGVKLDLGSTAKLRTLAHYLEVVGILYDETRTLNGEELERRTKADGVDPITRWVAETVRKTPDATLDAVLKGAMERKYSASPYETFFTGSGQHSFHNFDKGDNRRILTMHQALRASNNLVFIRLMRDLVRYHRDRLDYDAAAILADRAHPQRVQMLEQAADDEARTIMHKAFRRYQHQQSDAVIRAMLGSRAQSLRHLAILYYAWHENGTDAGLSDWLHLQLGKPAAAKDVQRLAKAYGGSHLTLSDYAYLLSRHPLDLWTAEQVARDPDVSWNDLFARSDEPRGVVASWLLRTKSRSAQDTRLRIRIERDAFARMTPYWQRLGFPFQRLVPTLATSIGNSSDRPAALAELMGIIVNDGVRLPMLRLTQMHLGAGTPYETVMTAGHTQGEQVMKPEVARVLREALAEVVDMGTARRLAGAFKQENGKKVVVGGKTGSGDNRFKTVNRSGGVTSSRAVNRTATFVFYIGDRYFGVLTSFVPGQESNRYSFTSALSVSVLRLLAPVINPRLDEAPADIQTELRWANTLPAPNKSTGPAQVTTLPASSITGG